MLTITGLADAEYLIGGVALGVEDYYVGAGEAPRVWQGRLAAELGLAGVVDPDQLRALLLGRNPSTDTELPAAKGRPRTVTAHDVTFSAPKSVSLLWAFASPEVAAVASIAHVEAVAVALDLLERRAGATRQQIDGVRQRIPTGVATATFVHRTSREGDPQLHTHSAGQIPAPALTESLGANKRALGVGGPWPLRHDRCAPEVRSEPNELAGGERPSGSNTVGSHRRSRPVRGLAPSRASAWPGTSQRRRCKPSRW